MKIVKIEALEAQNKKTNMSTCNCGSCNCNCGGSGCTKCERELNANYFRKIEKSYKK